ncbi:MAG: transcriptional repressor [Anaerolineae bacterium]
MSCEQVFVEQLRERGFRLTPQREMVLSVMHQLKDFATAEEIYERVQALSSAVDISTVYRTLELLQEFHLIALVDPGDGRRRYQLWGVHERQVHLVCRSCGRIMAADLELAEPLIQQLEEEYGFRVDVDDLSFTGLCLACSATGADVG